MPVPPATPPRLTLEEYLAFEHAQEIRHEFVDGYLYGMTGASERHERIAMNLALALGVHLRGSPCRVFKGDLKLAVGEDRYYPDLFVACGEPRPEGYSRDDPVLIVEVLSPSTARNDRGEKWLAYATLPSLREYVLVWQDRTRIERRTIAAAGGPGGTEVLESPSDTLRLESVRLAVTLGEIYA